MFLNLLFLLAQIVSSLPDFNLTIDGPHEITLPYEEDFVLIGHIIEGDNEIQDPSLYEIEWTPVSLPPDSKASERLDPNHPLTYRIPKGELTAGLYKFSLFVSSTSSASNNQTGFFDVAVQNMQSKVPLSVNIPPKIVQLPQTHLVLQPEINFENYPEESLTFKWEEKEVPLNTAELIVDAIKNEASLEIDVAPEPANITFLFVVSDNSDQKIEVTASLQIIEEKDEPPTAVILPKEFKITLPTSTAKLCGNSSTDDHEVVDYLWEVENDANPEVVDLSGSHEPCLSIKSIRKPGTYHFSLTVTDKKSQSDKTTATIIVDPAKNSNPVAKLEIENVMRSSDGSALYFIPSTKDLILNATKSFDPDDDKLSFSFARNPAKKLLSSQVIIIDSDDGRIARVSNITTVGLYKYQLTVTDDGEPQLSDVVEVVVNVTTGAKPTIVLEDELTRIGPRSNFAIDASKSYSFDGSALSFSWTADPSVLAGFTVYNSSIGTPVLQILNANIGTYKFTVTVTDKIGQTNSQTVTVYVLEDPEINAIIEITVQNCPMITKKESKDAETELLLNLADNQPEMSRVSVIHVFQPFHSPDLVILAKAYDVHENVTETSLVVPNLDGALVQTGGFKSFCRGHAVTARPLVCLLDCSAHGTCSNSTKECECDKFWVRNPMLPYQNCAWSLVYLVISVLVILISVAVSVLMLTRKRKRKKGRVRKHQKRRSDYAALHPDDSESDEEGPASKAALRATRKKRPLRTKRSVVPIKSDQVALIDSDRAAGSSDSDTIFQKTTFSEETL